MTSLPVAITSCDSAAPVLSVRPIAASVTIATVNATNLALTTLSTPYGLDAAHVLFELYLRPPRLEHFLSRDKTEKAGGVSPESSRP